MSDLAPSPHVLVIDDNRAIHEDFRKILGTVCAVDAEFDQLEALLLDNAPPRHPSNPVDLDSAYQGQEGYSMVQQAREEGRPYCLAFVDVRMPPGWDGIETVLKIWESDPEIQIVICSAYSDYSWEDMVRKLGQSDRFLVLKKPFDSIEVRQFVAALSQRWSEARTDVLTGLLNRRAFNDQSQRQVEIAGENGEPLSCVMLDLDFFKRVNDQYGHQAGDAVLRQVASVLAEHAKPSDLVCRYGGEEMCILLRGADEQAAAAWSEKVRQAIGDTLIESLGKAFRVTGSFGVAERRDAAMSIESLIDRADQALRNAKHSGRDTVSTHSTLGDALTGSTYESSRFAGVTAADLMEPLAALLDEDKPLGKSLATLVENKLDFAPVVNSDEEFVGTITSNRMLTVPIPGEQLEAATKLAMCRDTIHHDAATPLNVVFETLVRVSAPRVVILQGERPCGFIDRTILVRWLFTTGYRLAHTSSTPSAGAVPVLDGTIDPPMLSSPL